MEFIGYTLILAAVSVSLAFVAKFRGEKCLFLHTRGVKGVCWLKMSEKSSNIVGVISWKCTSSSDMNTESKKGKQPAAKNSRKNLVQIPYL